MGCSITGETAPCALWFRDAERSDDVDGVRHQFSRAGPDLGLRHAQLSRIRGGAVLDRLGLRRRHRHGHRDAGPGRGLADPAVGRRHDRDFLHLPGRDGDQAVLRSAGRMARHGADHRIDPRRHGVFHLRLRQLDDADRDLFGRPGGAAGADAEAADVAAGWPHQSRCPARGHYRHAHHRHLRLPRRGQDPPYRRRLLVRSIQRCRSRS